MYIYIYIYIYIYTYTPKTFGRLPDLVMRTVYMSSSAHWVGLCVLNYAAGF